MKGNNQICLTIGQIKALIFSWLPRSLGKRNHSIPCVLISVTRLGDLLHFGKLFKAFGNN